MFEIKDIPGEEYIRVIEPHELHITPLPPRINLNKKEEWIESGRKSPTAWRGEADDDFHFVKVKK